jgi:Rrf2 family protein
MMRITTKTEYGMRCMLRLAKQPVGQALSIAEISRHERVPRDYAEQILLRLRRAGLVRSIRGTQGGFSLAAPPEAISVGSILRFLEGIPPDSACDHFNRRADCGHLGDCSIRPIWKLIGQRLWEALDRITLEQLVANEKSVESTLAVALPVLTLPMAVNPPPLVSGHE